MIIAQVQCTSTDLPNMLLMDENDNNGNHAEGSSGYIGLASRDHTTPE
jgi:hypothetical protein